MEKSKPRFSIVIPAYNEAHFIAETITSLQDQNFKGEFEIIVVDNNSTDQTARIASSLGAVVVEETQPGVCFARQRGTEEAKGEIVISTDGDTTFAPDWLSKIDATFRQNPKIVAVTGPCRYKNGPIWGRIYTGSLFGLFKLVYLITRQTYYASATNIAFKKSAWTSYNIKLTQGGDELDLLAKLRKKGRIVYLSHNQTYTSSRRLVRGFIYNFFVSFLIFYILEYNLSKIFKRPILGSAPKFRDEITPQILAIWHVALTIVFIGLFALYTRPGHFLVRRSVHIIRSGHHELQERI
jgi:glycosyltransferase involved in cell wall biosynthesis